MDDPLIRSEDDLLEPFHAACKGPGVQLLGTESEKFGVQADNGKPVSYDGRKCGILGFFDRLMEAGVGWEPVYDSDGGPIIALERSGKDIGKAVVSLEPGAQLELSGAPVTNVHEAADELNAHLEEIAPLSKDCNVLWLSCGYHPVALPERLPWVPKERYKIMRAYFPEVGTRGLDMMRRTCTVQVNLDYADEVDAMRKLRVALALSPITTAIFANSPFAEAKPTGGRSERAKVWLDTDNNRAGLVPAVWKPSAGFRDYVGWALDVPMYFIKRAGKLIRNTGQTFRAFMTDGLGEHRATAADWVLHLNTLFPEVRLQRTIEVRGADALPAHLLPAVPALWAGVLYDDAALAGAEALIVELDHDAVAAARPDIAARALGAEIAGRPVRDIAERLVALADEGLARRARLDAEGRDERRHLAPIVAAVGRGECPADALLKGIDTAGSSSEALRDTIIQRTRMT